MQPHSQFSADLDFPQRPAPEGAQRTDGNELPQSTVSQWSKTKTILEVGRSDIDLPDIPGIAHAGTPENHHGSQSREKCSGDTEESNVKRTNPEIEEIPPDQGSAANAVLSFKTERGHWLLLDISGGSTPPIF